MNITIRHDICQLFKKASKNIVMKTIKNISLILALPLVIISFAQCASNKPFKLQKTTPFNINEAVSQQYLGGRQGNKGEKITISISGDSDIILNNLFYKNSILKLQKNENGDYTTKLVTSTGKHHIMHENPQEEYGNKAPVIDDNIPFKLTEKEAVISYLKDGTTFYYKIDNLTKGKLIIYP